MNTADVQKLIDEGRKVERQQAQVQAVLEEKKKELAAVELKIRTDFKCEPDELPDKIAETKAEIMRLAAEGGLIDDPAQGDIPEDISDEKVPEDTEVLTFEGLGSPAHFGRGDDNKWKTRRSIRIRSGKVSKRGAGPFRLHYLH